MNPSGTFSPGVVIHDNRGNCMTVKGKWDADTFVYDAGHGAGPEAIGRIIARPVHVEFADGTSWDAPNPPKAGDKVEAP